MLIVQFFSFANIDESQHVSLTSTEVDERRKELKEKEPEFAIDDS
jgi:hypothetical protein